LHAKREGRFRAASANAMQGDTSHRIRKIACRILLACAFALGIQLPAEAQGKAPDAQAQPEQKPSDQPTNPPSEPGQAPIQQTPVQQTPAQPPPDASTDQKNEPSANPVQQVEDKTKQAVDVTKEAATAGLLKARDWESGLITGVYVGRNRKLITLTPQEREEIYLRQTLTTPGAYLKRAFGAVIDQAEGTPRQWQGGIGGYAERFASREGQFITANSLAALGNAKLGYEVRYDKCKCDGLWPRTRHAFIRNLMTYDRSEEHLRPQWALYGGAFGGGMISTAWKPGNKQPFTNGATAMAGQVGWGTLLNFFTEFSREINRKQGVK
jgi:hypothetical protein